MADGRHSPNASVIFVIVEGERSQKIICVWSTSNRDALHTYIHAIKNKGILFNCFKILERLDGNHDK
jgi:molybdopterin-guanine dinucleotide biosynthesis protein A